MLTSTGVDVLVVVNVEKEMLTLLSFIDVVNLNKKVLSLSSQLTVDLLGKEVFNLFFLVDQVFHKVLNLLLTKCSARCSPDNRSPTTDSGLAGHQLLLTGTHRPEKPSAAVVVLLPPHPMFFTQLILDRLYIQLV